jgi:hypothetical protein
MTRSPRVRASNEDDDLTRLGDEEILALVQTRARRFERQIRLRDWREVIASGVVALLIAPAVARGPLVARLGGAVILAGLGLIVFRLWRARRMGGRSLTDVTLPVASALGAELQRVNAQIGLLGSVAWWYVSPIMVGSVVMVAGRNGRGAWLQTLAYAALAALLSWGIIALNQRAVRKTLQPKRDELLALLARLDS